MKQTAVEWLGKELEDYGDSQFCKIDWETLDLLLQQAKEKHKQEIMNAWYNGFEENRPYVDHSEDYYNETYGSKGSNMSEKPNDHIVDTNEMVDQFPDVRKMVEEDDELQFIKKQLENIEHYKLGYNAAQRKLYTKEEMELCWIAAMSNRAGFSDSISYKEFIQSLKKD